TGSFAHCVNFAAFRADLTHRANSAAPAFGGGLGYSELLPETDLMIVSEGVRIPVLRLARYIQLKEALGGEKDRAALPILRQALIESRRKERG
ncbi:MAG: hypothetical protein ACRD0Y_09690, partial [Terriglobales bacterium]